MTDFLVSLRLKLMRRLGFKIIFLSYRRRDSSDISGRLYDRLVKKYGKCCVIKDVNSIPLGVDFRDYIEQTIPLCNVFIAVIGPNWHDGSLDSVCESDEPGDMVNFELQCAVRHGLRIIPVLVGDAKIPARDTLPDGLKGLSGRQGMSLRADPDFHTDCSRLIAGL